ncbi:MAG: cobalamin biosynthesis protein [Micavibrio sp.]|nr:cobalamin biosynthesis protein [Micavibrio sp.]
MPALFAHLPPYAIVLLFFVLHLLVGALLPSRPGYRPLLWMMMDKGARAYEFRLNRSDRGNRTLAVRGGIVTALLGLAALLIGLVVWRAGLHGFGWLLSLLLLGGAVSAMRHVRRLRDAAGWLEKNTTAPLAALLQADGNEDFAKADSHTLARRVLERAAGSINRECVAPLFYFLLAGPVGLCLYVAFLAVFDAFGRAAYFGRMPRMLEAVLDFIPARLTAIALSLGALFVSRSNPLAGLKLALTQSSRFWRTNQGWPVAAVAGSLGITLGGPVRDKNNIVTESQWLGAADTTARIGAPELRRGAMLMFTTFLCIIVLVSAAVVVRHKFS